MLPTYPRRLLLRQHNIHYHHGSTENTKGAPSSSRVRVPSLSLMKGELKFSRENERHCTRTTLASYQDQSHLTTITDHSYVLEFMILLSLTIDATRTGMKRWSMEMHLSHPTFRRLTKMASGWHQKRSLMMCSVDSL